MISIREITEQDMDSVSELVARFRVELSNLKEIQREPDKVLGKEELEDYLKCNFPVYVAEDDDKTIFGYLVCRVDGEVVWAESLYVLPKYRRRGTASLLYDEAEKLAKKLGGDTVYNWVHPNNQKIINFLAKKGYDVLNLIEIRKLRAGEESTQKIKVDNNIFNY